jgi:hypothetical protein
MIIKVPNIHFSPMIYNTLIFPEMHHAGKKKNVMSLHIVSYDGSRQMKEKIAVHLTITFIPFIAHI